MHSRNIGWLLLIAGFHSAWRIATAYPQVSASDVLYIAAVYFLLIPLWTYSVFTEEGAHTWARFSVVLGLVGLSPVFFFSAAGLWLSHHLELPAYNPIADRGQSANSRHARAHRKGKPASARQLVRWSSIALAIASLSFILLDFKLIFSANIYYATVQFAASGLLSVGFVGLVFFQGNQSGHLGWTGLVTLIAGLILQAADMAYWLFRPGSQLYLLVYETGGVIIAIGLLTTGIAMSRGKVFSLYVGFGLIVADLLSILYSSRIPVGVFLFALAGVLFTGKPTRIASLQQDAVKAD